jgi:hypothetical protein
LAVMAAGSLMNEAGLEIKHFFTRAHASYPAQDFTPRSEHLSRILKDSRSHPRPVKFLQMVLDAKLKGWRRRFNFVPGHLSDLVNQTLAFVGRSPRV